MVRSTRSSFVLLMTMVIGAVQSVPTTSSRSNTTARNSADDAAFCDAPFVVVGQQCLLFATFADATYKEAKQLCHSMEGELAAVLTSTLMEHIVNYIYQNEIQDKTFWIDGSDEVAEGDWRTSSGQPIPMGTPFWATTLTWSQPDNGHNAEHCLHMYSGYNHYWNDEECNLNYNPLCSKTNQHFVNEDKAVKSCPPLFVDVGGLCLAFITWADQTWAEARQSCHGLSGELASITDSEQLRAVYRYLHQEEIADHSFWLGGSDSDKEGSWVWSHDGSSVPSGTPFWGLVDAHNQEPEGGSSENCLALMSKGGHYFRDAACHLLMNPLCLHL